MLFGCFISGITTIHRFGYHLGDALTNELIPRRKYTYKGNRILERISDSLKSEEDRKIFLKMLNVCQKYALAINAKETPFPTECLIMALLLSQQKMIRWLSKQVSFQKMKPVNPKVELQEGFNDSAFVMK